MRLDLTDDQLDALMVQLGSHVHFLARYIERRSVAGRDIDSHTERLAKLREVESMLCAQTDREPYRPPAVTAKDVIRDYVYKHPLATKHEIARETGYALRTVVNTMGKLRKEQRTPR